MKDNRDISLDWFKGLCMALVMMVHIGGAKICHAGLPVGFCSWANSFKLIGFFVVSGFLLSIKNSTFESLEGRGGHRWRSVMYPYFLFSLLLLLIMPFFNTDNLGSATSCSKAIAINIVTFRGQSTLWFLPVLFISEMAFICVLTLERRLSFSTGVCRFRWPIVVSTGLVLLLHSLLSPLARPFIDEPIGRQIVASWILPWLRAMPAFVAFAAGAVLLPLLIRILKERKPAFAAAGIAFLLLGWLGSRALGVVNWASNIYGGNIVLFLASGLMSSFGFILLFKIVAPHLKLPILAYIGVNSLILMATHLPFPLIKLTEGIYEATLGRIPLANDFLLSHGMLKSLTLLSVLLVIEFPIVWLFTHTRLCILLGRRWDGEGWMKLQI